MKRHLIIPDTQVAPGVPLDHFKWIGRAIMDYKPDVIVHLGDHWDFPSLSHWDRGKPKKMEGRRLKDDIEAGNKAMDILLKPLQSKTYKPRLIFLYGNHEDRLTRQIDAFPQELDGLVSFKDLNLKGWKAYPFLKPVIIDGVAYAHYFYNAMSGRAYGGTAHTKLKNIGCSFTMGHQQGKDYAERQLPTGQRQLGLVCGSCYLHDEEYLGPQAQNEWRGIVIKNDVRKGDYDIMPLSLSYLERRYG
jgi:hypothetical protein